MVSLPPVVAPSQHFSSNLSRIVTCEDSRLSELLAAVWRANVIKLALDETRAEIAALQAERDALRAIRKQQHAARLLTFFSHRQDAALRCRDAVFNLPTRETSWFDKQKVLIGEIRTSTSEEINTFSNTIAHKAGCSEDWHADETALGKKHRELAAERASARALKQQDRGDTFCLFRGKPAPRFHQLTPEDYASGSRGWKHVAGIKASKSVAIRDWNVSNRLNFCPLCWLDRQRGIEKPACLDCCDDGLAKLDEIEAAREAKRTKTLEEYCAEYKKKNNARLAARGWVGYSPEEKDLDILEARGRNAAETMTKFDKKLWNKSQRAKGKWRIQ